MARRRPARFRRVPWDLTTCVAEGAANFRAGRGRSITVVAVVVLAVCGVALGETATVDRIVEDQRRFIAAGGNVVLARGDIDPRSCAALTAHDTVVASAAVRRLPEALQGGLPGQRIPLVVTTAGVVGLAPLVDGTWPVSGELAASTGAAESDDLGTGRLVALGQQTYRVAGVVEMGRIGEDFDSGLVALGWTGQQSDVCVAEATTPATTTLESTLGALVTRAGSTVDVARRIPETAFGVDHPAAYENRSTRLLWLPVGGAVGLLWAAVMTARRSERGLYSSVGADGATTSAIYLVEFGLAVASGVAIALVASVVAVEVGLPDVTSSELARYGTAPGVRVAATALLVGVLVSTTGPREPISELVKDR